MKMNVVLSTVMISELLYSIPKCAYIAGGFSRIGSIRTHTFLPGHVATAGGY
jgi:hypothetical protein